MSAAFRNFILTLLIMLCLFTYAAMKMLPDVEDVLFTDDNSSEDPSKAIIDVSDTVSGEESGTAPVTEEKDALSCVFASKNAAGDICSLIYAEISDETRSYITCRIPVDVYLDDKGIPTPLYELLGDNNTDYLLKKISPLIGKDIGYYIIADGDTFVASALIAEKKNAAITVDLSYPVRFFDKTFSDIIDPSEAGEEFFITLPVGKTALTETNAAEIFNSSRSADIISYTFQESMGLSVFRQLAAVSAASEDITSLTALYNSVDTNIPLDRLSRYARLFFAFSEYKNTHITYPTVYQTGSEDIKIPDWRNGITLLKSASGS